jgi:hypothetical protein
MNKFKANDRIRVSPDFFWAKGALGTISEPPSALIALSGAWEDGLSGMENSALGVHKVYWVWFDEPQLDADGDGPYRAGSIWEESMTLI